MTAKEWTATTRGAAFRECAEWLAACIRLGWRHEDLDFLEGLWWKYHDKPDDEAHTVTK